MCMKLNWATYHRTPSLSSINITYSGQGLRKTQLLDQTTVCCFWVARSSRFLSDHLSLTFYLNQETRKFRVIFSPTFCRWVRSIVKSGFGIRHSWATTSFIFSCFHTRLHLLTPSSWHITKTLTIHYHLRTPNGISLRYLHSITIINYSLWTSRHKNGDLEASHIVYAS